MTQEQHPITPPPELVHEWQIKIEYASRRADREALVSKVFQLGADYELEACCEWMRQNCQDGFTSDLLRSARRPKPPSLADQALEQLRGIETCFLVMHGGGLIDDVIHAALKRLKELEEEKQ